MTIFWRLFRVLAIQRALIRHGFDELLFTTPLLRSLSFLVVLLPWNWRRKEYAPRAERIRSLMEELGPIFVKFGQILSTRRDLLPEDIAEELSKLQDCVPPFPGEIARRITERELGCPLTEIFSMFDEEPLASASIAQVHAAELLDGREVIVKVVRPGIRKTIQSDIGLMYMIAEMAERYSPHGRILKPSGIVAELEKTILDELDLMREAANASQLKRNFSDSDRMYVPAIDWEHTRQNVMVMERIRGIAIDDVEELKAAGIDLKDLAETGVDIFFTQVFRDHFFHADMHPGNLFVIPGAADEELPKFAPVDFGIMGSLSEVDQRYLADNFSALLERDYRRVAELHLESGWVPSETRIDEFEFAIRTVCEPILDRPVKDISIGRLLLRLIGTARRFNVEIMPQLILLQKTLVNVEGVGRQLYPDLDLWAAARPSLERWMKDRIGLRRVARNVRDHAADWTVRLPELPGMVMATIDQIQTGRIQVNARDPQIEFLREEVRRAHRRLVLAIVGVGFLVAAAMLHGNPTGTTMMIGPARLSVWLFGTVGAGAIITSLLRR